MPTIPLLASKYCHPCCWFAREKKCKCSCQGTNHGTLNPIRPQGLKHATTERGQTYQGTLFALEPRVIPLRRVLDSPQRTSTETHTGRNNLPRIQPCTNCNIPIAPSANAPSANGPQRCAACTRLRASHRPFVIARLQRLINLILPDSGPSAIQAALELNSQPPQNAGPSKSPTGLQHPWFLLP